MKSVPVTRQWSSPVPVRKLMTPPELCQTPWNSGCWPRPRTAGIHADARLELAGGGIGNIEAVNLIEHLPRAGAVYMKLARGILKHARADTAAHSEYRGHGEGQIHDLRAIQRSLAWVLAGSMAGGE
jgi:hypothetical protein